MEYLFLTLSGVYIGFQIGRAHGYNERMKEER